MLKLTLLRIKIYAHHWKGLIKNALISFQICRSKLKLWVIKEKASNQQKSLWIMNYSSTPELLQCTPFEALGLQQAFEVKVSSNAIMMMVSILEYNHDIQ